MRRLTAVALLASLVLTGCYKWTRADPMRPVPAGEERLVRITRSDSTVYLLHGARTTGDSLIGRTEAGIQGPVRIAYSLPLEDVAIVEYRAFAPLETAAAVATPVVFFVGVSALIFAIEGY